MFQNNVRVFTFFDFSSLTGIAIIKDRIMYMLYGGQFNRLIKKINTNFNAIPPCYTDTKFLFSEFVLSAVIFLLMLLYFPSRPPSPPSPSADIPRVPYLHGLKALITLVNLDSIQRFSKYIVTISTYKLQRGAANITKHISDLLII